MNDRSAVRVLTCGLLLLVMGACTVQSDFSIEKGETPGLVNYRLNRIDDAINAEISAGRTAGAVAVVVKDGRTAYHKSFGYADIASRTRMEIDSIFRIASMTKAVTTIAVMQLYEQGLFQLNDPVSRFVPAFENPQVLVNISDEGMISETRPAESEISIIDLLTHASGISYAFIETPLQRVYKRKGVIDGLTEKNIKLETVMEKLAAQPLLFDPGTAWAYGLNTDLLGYLVEVISGKTLDQYFADEIFAPLRMDDTYFYIPDSKAERLVTLYADVDGLRVSAGDESSIFLDNPNYPIDGAKTYFSGGAGLSSTATDYARLIEMLLNNGELDGARVLSRKSVELMRSPRVDSDQDGKADFGLGFSVITDLGADGELGSEGLYQWGGAFATSYWIDPEENLVAVLMMQQRPNKSDLANKFRTLVYQALE